MKGSAGQKSTKVKHWRRKIDIDSRLEPWEVHWFWVKVVRGQTSFRLYKTFQSWTPTFWNLPKIQPVFFRTILLLFVFSLPHCIHTPNPLTVIPIQPILPSIFFWGDGAIIRIQLSVAWLFAQQQTFNLEKQQMCPLDLQLGESWEWDACFSNQIVCACFFVRLGIHVVWKKGIRKRATKHPVQHCFFKTSIVLRFATLTYIVVIHEIMGLWLIFSLKLLNKYLFSASMTWLSPPPWPTRLSAKWKLCFLRRGIYQYLQTRRWDHWNHTGSMSTWRRST